MLELTRITLPEILDLEKRYRANLINGILGYKPANLIATLGKNGVENVAIFNSTIHIGATPPLVGFIMRPLTVPRQTYTNIKESGYYTINHVHSDMIWEAHQSSAKYPEDVSEFAETGLKPWYSENFKIPYVEKSFVKMGLKFVEELPIQANGTLLIVGEVQELFYPEHIVSEDGTPDLNAIETVSVTGLDVYHLPQKLKRFSYPRPHQKGIEI